MFDVEIDLAKTPRQDRELIQGKRGGHLTNPVGGRRSAAGTFDHQQTDKTQKLAIELSGILALIECFLDDAKGTRSVPLLDCREELIHSLVVTQSKRRPDVGRSDRSR